MQQTQEEYIEKQLEWIHRYNVKIGDEVIITRSIVNSYTKGWASTWKPDMHSAVGKKGVIAGFGEEQGILIDCMNFYKTYPFYILEFTDNRKGKVWLLLD